MTSSPLIPLAQTTRSAARRLANLSADQRNQAIEAMAQALEANQAAILQANQLDCQQAQADGLSAALRSRLKLDAPKLTAAITGMRVVGDLGDPLGKVKINRLLDQGLRLERVTCPVGVLAVVFEARPEAVVQIAALAVKSGNGVLLKGGREALHSCTALVQTLRRGLEATAVSPEVIQLLTTRAEVQGLLALDAYVDLVIPRGSNEFVRYIQANTRIPVLGHADGLCHLYVDAAADLDQAVAITLDAKTQYPAACNAIETLLVHQHIAPTFLPRVAPALAAQGVELRAEPAAEALIAPLEVCRATEADWGTEYTDLILAIKIVPDLEAAVEHINTYGSRHTEAIVTQDPQAAQTFMADVDAAGVYHNCSTRFADGYRYGFGAEVGISTQKLPPRGPVGLEGLVTYKYRLWGKGQVVANYGGALGRAFLHQDIPCD